LIDTISWSGPFGMFSPNGCRIGTSRFDCLAEVRLALRALVSGRDWLSWRGWPYGRKNCAAAMSVWPITNKADTLASNAVRHAPVTWTSVTRPSDTVPERSAFDSTTVVSQRLSKLFRSPYFVHPIWPRRYGTT
jgi:hypothetical protein